MSPEEKAAELVRELNAFAEGKLKNGEYAEAEERFRAALGVYHEWAKQPSYRHSAVLGTIAGLVKSLEAQGRPDEAANILEAEEPTITALIGVLRTQITAE